ncbi:MAG: hypothetical protein ACRDHP_07435, partial [Ktedonobacterales bacterium]
MFNSQRHLVPSTQPDAPNPLPGKPLAVLAPILGVIYLVWRARSLPGAPLWLALPTLAADLYLFGVVILLAAAAWRLAGSTPAHADVPPALPVDVFILAHDEPPPLLAASLRAAARLRYPHTTYVLDSVSMPARAALARSYGCQYVALPAEPREDSDGNASHDVTDRLVAEALASSVGAVALLVRAGQLPAPRTLERALP